MQVTAEPEYDKNEHGIVQYPKGDARRLMVLVAAIDIMERPTLNSIARYTSWNKGSVFRDIDKVQRELGVTIEKNGPVYSIQAWGDRVNREGVIKCLTGGNLGA